VLIDLQHERCTHHHGVGKQVPLDFDPSVRGNAEAVSDEGISRADQRSKQYSPRGKKAQLLADPIHAFGKFQ